MKKLLLSSWLLTLFFALPLLAQDVTISGRVTSSDDGSGLPGVSVQLKGSSRGTTTDANGNYKFNAPSGARVVFSYIGFTPQEIAVGNRTTLNVVMQASASELSEVVVTGYGNAARRQDITGAVAAVTGKTIENLPMQSVDRALQGRAAGVQVTALSGQPGGALNVRIRGVGSINAGNNPLYVIDGVQVSDGGLSGQASSNVLTSLNPNDIESIDILKDAAAAAIYGAQGANGVVVITTKRGRSGRTKFNLSVQDGFTDVLKKLDVLTASEFATLKIENFVNRAVQTNASVETARTSAITQYGDPSTVQNTEWQDAVFQRGRLRMYDLSASGGDGKTNFYIAGSYNFQEGTGYQIRFPPGDPAG